MSAGLCERRWALPLGLLVLVWSTYRALGDLRAEFQRTMSEPPSISRSATAWWPAVVGLEQVLDAVAAVSLAVSRGASVPSPAGVQLLGAALDAVAEAGSAGIPPPADLELPDDETLQPVTGRAVPVMKGEVSGWAAPLSRAGLIGRAGR